MSVNVSNKCLDRDFFLDKIQEEIKSFETELNNNYKELDSIQDSIWDIKPNTRNNNNPEYKELSRRRSKLYHRNITVQNKLKRLMNEYEKYKVIEL